MSNDDYASCLLYGTAFKADDTMRLVKQAVCAGFRAFDTAAVKTTYREDLLSEALQELFAEGMLTDRSELYVLFAKLQTKFSPYKDGRDPAAYPYDNATSLEEQIQQSVASSLRHFTFNPASSEMVNASQAPYIDSLLLHSPLSTIPETIQAWKILEQFVPHQIRALGVSNVSLVELQSLCEHARVKPTIVQNRLAPETYNIHPFPLPTPIVAFDADVRKWCAENDVWYQPWGVLEGNKPVLESRVVSEVAESLELQKEVALTCCVRGLGKVRSLIGTAKEERMRAMVNGERKWRSWVNDQETQQKWNAWMKRLEEETGLGA